MATQQVNITVEKHSLKLIKQTATKQNRSISNFFTNAALVEVERESRGK